MRRVLTAVLLFALAVPAFARVDDMGPRLRLVADRGLPMQERGENARLVYLDLRALDEDVFDLRIGDETQRAEVVEREVGSDVGIEIVRFYIGDYGELSTLVRTRSRVVGLLQSSTKRYFVRPESGWHVLTDEGATPTGVKRARRRAVRSGPAPEMIYANWSFWYHSRLSDFLGGEAETKLALESLAAILNTALEETGNTFFRLRLARVEQANSTTAQGGPVVRPNYSEQLDSRGSMARFEEDAYMRQVRYDNQLSFATYVDITNGVAAGCAHWFDGTPTWNDGLNVILWGELIATVLIHEIGHNLGLLHDLGYDPPGHPDYWYGFVDAKNGIQDVMAGQNLKILLRYSNVLHEEIQGVPFGGPSDGARRIREVAPVARDFWKYAASRQW